MTLRSVIFLTGIFSPFAVLQSVGKNMEIRYSERLSSGRVAIPLNPVADQVEGCTAYRRLEQIPECPESVCLVTPPSVTLSFVQEAIELGVRSLWVQPGSQHSEAGQLARDAGINVIDDGRCILVALLEL